MGGGVENLEPPTGLGAELDLYKNRTIKTAVAKLCLILCLIVCFIVCFRACFIVCLIVSFIVYSGRYKKWGEKL